MMLTIEAGANIVYWFETRSLKYFGRPCTNNFQFDNYIWCPSQQLSCGPNKYSSSQIDCFRGTGWFVASNSNPAWGKSHFDYWSGCPLLFVDVFASSPKPSDWLLQAIYFSAKLRLPRSTKESQLEKLTERMISELGLTSCADTMVGGELIKGISGGERKRTSVGVELVVKPALVFLDEPTSGLDSYSAVQLCQVLKKVANAGARYVAVVSMLSLLWIAEPTSQQYLSSLSVFSSLFTSQARKFSIPLITWFYWTKGA